VQFFDQILFMKVFGENMLQILFNTKLFEIKT
jgi:hypothetical protein